MVGMYFSVYSQIFQTAELITLEVNIHSHVLKLQF